MFNKAYEFALAIRALEAKYNLKLGKDKDGIVIYQVPYNNPLMHLDQIVIEKEEKDDCKGKN